MRAAALESKERFPLARLFCTCWLIYTVHWAPFLIREQLPAITLATSGSLNVERYLGWSPDVFRGPAGGAFINNNPGASMLGAIPLILARPALRVIERWNDRRPSSIELSRDPRFADRVPVQERREWYFLAIAFLTTAGAMAPISALVVVALAWLLWREGVSQGRATAVALLLGFGTPVFLRTEYLNHNLLVGHAGLLAALVLWGSAEVKRVRAVAAGALGGFAVLCDYSGLLVLAWIGMYVWLRAGDTAGAFRERVRAALYFSAGAIPMLVVLAAYQAWAFGSTALPSQHFMPAIAETAHGYRGFGWPSLELLTMNYFDRRFGLFAVSPLLIVGLAAPLIRSGRFRLPPREMWLALSFFAALSLFCASNQYSQLQWSTGIRYMVPAIPGLVLLTAQVLQLLPALVRNIVLVASLLVSWLWAGTYGSLLNSVEGPGRFQLAWTRRMAEYGGIASPVATTAIVLGVTAFVVVVVWRRELLQTAGGVANRFLGKA